MRVWEGKVSQEVTVPENFLGNFLRVCSDPLTSALTTAQKQRTDNGASNQHPGESTGEMWLV